MYPDDFEITPTGTVKANLLRAAEVLGAIQKAWDGNTTADGGAARMVEILALVEGFLNDGMAGKLAAKAEWIASHPLVLLAFSRLI